MPEEDPRRRYTANLQGEVDSAALYRTLAQTEKNPQLAQVYPVSYTHLTLPTN